MQHRNFLRGAGDKGRRGTGATMSKQKSVPLRRYAKQSLMLFLFPAMLACSGLGGSPNAAAPTALDTVDVPKAVPGATVGETATKFDPEGTYEYGFLESDRKFSRQGTGYVTALHGQVFHLGKNALFNNNAGSVPCCEGRWLLVRDTLHNTCAAAPIGSEGDWRGTVPAEDALLPNLFFYLGNEEYIPGSEGILGDCSNVNFENWSKYPIGYMRPGDSTAPAVFANPPSNQAVDGIVHPASSGIRSVKTSGPEALPSLESIDSSRLRLQLPATGSDSDSDSDSGEKVKK